MAKPKPKKLSSSKKLSFRSPIAIAVLSLFVAAGILLAFKTFAASDSGTVVTANEIKSSCANIDLKWTCQGMFIKADTSSKDPGSVWQIGPGQYFQNDPERGGGSPTQTRKCVVARVVSGTGSLKIDDGVRVENLTFTANTMATVCTPWRTIGNTDRYKVPTYTSLSGTLNILYISWQQNG